MKKIYLHDIKHYFLTVDTNGIRKHHMMNEFKDFDINEVNPIIGIERSKSVATGFSKMIDLGLRNQNKILPFQPFIIYEDDCSKYREFPNYIDIPDDADLLYIGISQYSIDSTSHHYNNYFEIINDDIIKIQNMLSAHGIMICSAAGAIAIQKAVLEGYFKNAVFDIFLAQIQHYYNVYALKVPLVYQDSKYGGCEYETQFSINSTSNNILPDEFINKTNDSVLNSFV